MPSSGKGAATWSLSLMAGLLNWGEVCSGQIMKVLVFRWSPMNNNWDWILLMRVWQGSDSEAGKNFSHGRSQLSAFTCSLAYWVHTSGDWAEVFSRAHSWRGEPYHENRCNCRTHWRLALCGGKEAKCLWNVLLCPTFSLFLQVRLVIAIIAPIDCEFANEWTQY